MCGLKEYDFSADLVIFSHSGPKLRMWFSFFSFEYGFGKRAAHPPFLT